MLVIGGKRFYIVTAAQDVTDIYRNTTTLSFDIFTEQVMQ